MCKSTNYYRKNKTTQRVIHVCPHCNYSTTGPKISLKHHIFAKHTQECDRPFQCHYPDCNRGFAQKLHYDRHLCNIHGETQEEGGKKRVLYYTIKKGNIDPTWKKTKERMKFYKENSILTTKKIRENITMSCFHYDIRYGYITAVSITENDILNSVIVCH